jgi:hypothetical protein
MRRASRGRAAFPQRSYAPGPSLNAACAAFRQPVRRYNPERCWPGVVSLIPSS